MDQWRMGKAQVMARLKRAEGQVRAVMGMVEREEECERVAQQLSAARKALDRAFYELMGCMTQRELSSAGVGDRATLKQVGHMTDILARYG